MAAELKLIKVIKQKSCLNMQQFRPLYGTGLDVCIVVVIFVIEPGM
jgi:hypothetical protein